MFFLVIPGYTALSFLKNVETSHFQRQKLAHSRWLVPSARGVPHSERLELGVFQLKQRNSGDSDGKKKLTVSSGGKMSSCVGSYGAQEERSDRRVDLNITFISSDFFIL